MIPKGFRELELADARARLPAAGWLIRLEPVPRAARAHRDARVAGARFTAALRAPVVLRPVVDAGRRARAGRLETGARDARTEGLRLAPARAVVARDVARR